MRVWSRISCMVRPNDSLASFSRRPISRDTRHTSHKLSQPNNPRVSFLFEYNLLPFLMSKSSLNGSSFHQTDMDHFLFLIFTDRFPVHRDFRTLRGLQLDPQIFLAGFVREGRRVGFQGHLFQAFTHFLLPNLDPAFSL